MGNTVLQPARLPHQLSDFVDRRQELREIRRLLEIGRLATLIGPGGVGKTRLALRVAAEVSRAFPDGVGLAQLSDVSDPELVPAAVSMALGIRDLSAARPVDILVEHLRAARLLVVLDNCEHVQSGCQEVVHAVLSACSGVRILATSRHRLNTIGEYLFEVEPLPVPSDDAARLSDTLTNPVVELFQNRGAKVRPDFTVDETNAEAVVEVCRRTEGIPLAVELAAVRLRLLSPSQLLDALQDRFRTLTHGYTTAPQRQRTLRAMVDWSFELCTKAERSLWLRSCVFSGGFDVEAASAVCTDQDLPATDMLDLVQGLVDKSILQCEDHGEHVRFTMLDTLRDYGRELLAKHGELAHWQSRHREWCRQLVQRAAEESFGPGQRAWAQRLAAEQSNLRAALGSSLAGPKEAEVGLEIAAALRFSWFTSALLTEGRRWLHLLLDLAVPNDTPTRVAALEVAGYLASLQGEPEAARPLLDEARALGTRLRDDDGLVRVAYAQGLLQMLTGNLAEAVPLFQESLDLQHSASGLPSMMSALTCSHLSTLASVTGDLDAAARWVERALRMSEAAGEIWCRAFALWAGGIAALRRGEYERAVHEERESLRLNQSYGDKVHSALAIEALAWIAAETGVHQRAAMLLGGLDTAWHDMGAALFGHVTVLHDQCVAQCRAALGRDGFTRAFSSGRGLAFGDLVARALGQPEGAAPAPAPADTSPLTPREQEVAALVADGKSNREIAETLVISQRTAEAHVENILAKLGFTSRTQIAVWVAARQHPDT